eukprot:scaffold85166_cov28-Tisochrysis_lutea.AAC.2
MQRSMSAPATSPARGPPSTGAGGWPPAVRLPCDLSVTVPVNSPLAVRTPELPPGELLPELLLAEPTVSERELSADDRFLILACDGVWDVMTDQQACDCVRAVLDGEHGTPEAAAKKLVREAYAAGSMDNISAVVAVLRPYLL